jgi:heme/copper-type cytochrome/quinol oxidase subunit 3
MQVANSEPGDGYLERMVKYVPAEIIAFSMVINAILDQAMKSGGENAAMAGVPVPIIATGALVVACMLTPLFCWYVRRDGDAWIVNAVVSTIALPFWAYLMGAVAFANHHDGNLAAILVMSFTVVSGLVAPRADKPKLREQQEVANPERPRLVDVLAG